MNEKRIQEIAKKIAKKEVNRVVDAFNKRLDTVKQRIKKGIQEPEEYWVSMDYDGSWDVFKVKKVKPDWKRIVFVPSMVSDCWISRNNEKTPPPGLQPGMLCKAVKCPKLSSGGINMVASWTYRITSVVECNLDIEVDWRECEYNSTNPKRPCMYPSWGTYNYRCPFGDYDMFDCDSIPYLPGTDVMITCEFIECAHTQPKLITYDLLEKRGAWVEILEWFEDQYGKPTFPKSIVALIMRIMETAPRSKQVAWIMWILNNLWDYA